jgi:Diguanylate cyclase, GGDEF domain
MQEGSGIRDDLRLLENAGLKERSVMVKKQDALGENELRLLLSKHSDAGVNEQVELYKRLPKKFTVADVFEEGPASKVIWVPIVYRLFANGLIDIKPPLAVNESALDFMAEGKAAVQALKPSFVRQESGILSYPALLYFLQYEYLRFQTYDTPFSLIVFEMSKIGTSALGGLDLINKQETLEALNRINAIKRPLDFLGHFEAINYALLLPHTNIHAAGKMAKRIVKSLSTQPLAPNLDPSQLKLSFGIGSIPDGCGDMEELIVLSKKALQQSKNGDFQIVQAGDGK